MKFMHSVNGVISKGNTGQFEQFSMRCFLYEKRGSILRDAMVFKERYRVKRLWIRLGPGNLILWINWILRLPPPPPSNFGGPLISPLVSPEVIPTELPRLICYACELMECTCVYLWRLIRSIFFHLLYIYIYIYIYIYNLHLYTLILYV